MTSEDWLAVPIGSDAVRWVTRQNLRTVLVVAHSVTALQRLLDVVPLFETDHRVQTLFTEGPGSFSRGVARLIEEIGGIAVPWEQATRTAFDLAIASGYTNLHDLRAPVIVLPHGASFNKFVPTSDSSAPEEPAVYGLNPKQLIRDGRVVPTVIGIPHEDELPVLKAGCPEAVGNAVVIGDPCLDRILLSRRYRSDYRALLGMHPHRKMLAISSTWGPASLLGSALEIFDRVMSEAAERDFTVAAMLHPGVWTGHGARQVIQWFRRYLDGGLILVRPDEEWRSVLLSADWFIGDHGSATLYGAAAGAAVLHTDVPADLIVPGSAMALLHELTPVLQMNLPMYPQLVAAAATDDALIERVIARSASVPGASGMLLRRVIYHHLALDEPSDVAELHPVSPIFRDAQVASRSSGL